MDKLLSFFLFNRGIKKGRTSNFLIATGMYIAIFVVLTILKSILITVPVLGKFIYNLRGIYAIYALAGIIIGILQCFTDIKFGKPKALSIQKTGKFVWIGIGVICIAMLFISPRGYEKAKFRKLAKKSINESSKTSDVVASDAKLDDTKVDNNLVGENEPEVEEGYIDPSQYQEIFYEAAKGYWTDGEIVYDFTHFLKNTDVMYRSDLVDTVGNFLYVYDKNTYLVKELNKTDDELTATLSRGDETMEVVITGQDTMQLKETTNGDFVTLKNINLTSIDELLEQDEYKALHLQAWFNDRENKTDIGVGIGVPTYNKETSRIIYEDYFPEYPGKELIVEDYGSYLGTYTVWAIQDGIVRPVLGIAGIDPEIPLMYDENDNTLWGNDWDYNGSRYYVSYSAPQEYSIYWDEKVNYEEIYLNNVDGYVKAPFTKANGEPEDTGEFTVNDSMVITGDVGGYCGEYFSGFEIKNISEDLLTVAGQNDSYRYMGLLARQTQYPDGTYVYGGTIDATPVVMGRNSFSGTFAIVLQPDGTVYIQNVSGDAFINNDYYSHE